MAKKALTFSDSSRLTCYTNDYGWDDAYSKFIEQFATNKSLVILISSSVNSENIYRACDTSKNLGYDFLILTGFDNNNRIKRDFSIHSVLDYWVNSKDYGVVESVHGIYLHSVI